MINFNINVSTLNKVSGANFSATNEAEKLISNVICYKYGLTNYGPNPKKGYAPEFDYQINNTKIEQKIVSNYNPFIELVNRNGGPSGLLLSKSDLYLFLSLGKYNGIEIMKCRLVLTAELLFWAQHILTNNENSLVELDGKKGFMLDFIKMNIDNLYIMGFPITKSNQNTIIDTSAPIMPDNMQYIEKQLRQYIK